MLQAQVTADCLRKLAKTDIEVINNWSIFTDTKYNELLNDVLYAPKVNFNPL